MNTKVSLCGITLDNPVIPASGTFGYGYEFAELYDNADYLRQMQPLRADILQAITTQKGG